MVLKICLLIVVITVLWGYYVGNRQRWR